MKRKRFNIVCKDSSDNYQVIEVWGYPLQFDHLEDVSFFIDERTPNDWRVSESTLGYALPGRIGHTMKEAKATAEEILSQISPEVFTSTLTECRNHLIRNGIQIPVNQ